MTRPLGLYLVGLAAVARSQSCGCTADETCCSDSSGYVCCVDLTTYCIAPNRSVSKEFPARCCPQWTVGCQTGSVGCCDPARPWQRTLTATVAKVSTAVRAPSSSFPEKQTTTVYALFSSSAASDLNALTIDAATGAISALVPVSGPAKEYFAGMYGEETRVFPFDPSRNKFFLMDIKHEQVSAKSPITLYGIDPATGTSTAVTVSGATGFVMSFAYHPESTKMIVAVGERDDVSFNFFSVDLDTAIATHLGTVPRGSSEVSAPQYYAAYISNVDVSGKNVLRLGYKQVTQGTEPGLGITDITGSNNFTWSEVPAAQGEDFYYSLTRPKDEETFLSLAPSTAFNHTLAVVQWSASTRTSKVIADIPDAHPPETKATGILGYVADDVNTDVYVALAVQKNPSVLPGLKDRWEIILVDRTGGTGGTSTAISGDNFDPLGAETISCSGVGIRA